MSKILRVKPDVRAAVFVSTHQSMVTLVPGDMYQSDDAVVKEHPWAFQRDSDVEEASAVPGERRAR